MKWLNLLEFPGLFAVLVVALKIRVGWLGDGWLGGGRWQRHIKSIVVGECQLLV